MASDLSDSDNEEISEATNCVKVQKESVDESITNFKEKGRFGLWWDGKGLRNTSDKETVLDCMAVYRELLDDILRCIELAANNDENAYGEIKGLYKKIKKLRKDAETDAKGKSKALCSLAEEFLDNHFKLHHSLKRVENLILKKGVRETTATVAKLKENVTKAFRNLDTFEEDNRKLKDSVKYLEKENRDIKGMLEKLFKDNKDILNTLAQTNETANQRFSEMVEKDTRAVQEMIRKFQDMTGSE